MQQNSDTQQQEATLPYHKITLKVQPGDTITSKKGLLFTSELTGKKLLEYRMRLEETEDGRGYLVSVGKRKKL